MAQPTKNPQRFGGTVTNSGAPATGQVRITYGGEKVACIFSGGLLTLGSGNLVPVSNPGTGHAVLWSGPGRLDAIQAHQSISGSAIQIYDSYTVAASGVATVPAAGYPILHVVPANTIGSYGVLGGGPNPIPGWGVFNNGLAVNMPSGAPGISIYFTPEVTPSVL